METKVKELEARCAAMRETLQEAISLLKGEKRFPEDLTIWGPGGYNVVRIKNVIEQGEKALSNDTGKALLERMAKLEAVVEAAKDYVQAIDDIWAGRYDLSAVPEGEMLSEEIRLRKALAELEEDKNV